MTQDTLTISPCNNNDGLLPRTRLPTRAEPQHGIRALERLHLPRGSRILAIPTKIVYGLTPQLVRTKLWHDTPPNHRLTSTSWMDGLRGVASLVVFTHHFLVYFTRMGRYGFGCDKDYRQVLSLPIIRLYIEGPTAVCLFFVITGYVSSIKALRLMSTNQQSELMQSLSGSLFRKWFRLYLPTFSIMAITAIATQLGWFEYTRPMMANAGHMTPPGTNMKPNLKRNKHAITQLHYLLKEFWQVADIFNPAQYFPNHNGNLWTIPYEYRGTLLLYASLVGLARCRTYVRLAGFLLISAALIVCSRWEAPLFFLGAAIAQIDVIRENNRSVRNLARQKPDAEADMRKQEQTEQESESTPLQRLLLRPEWRSILRATSYFVALMLMSYPKANSRKPAPGYGWIEASTPWWYPEKKRFPKSIGSVLFVYLLSTTPNPTSSVLMRIFNSAVPQYLGRIMFALYLCHNTILRVIGYAIPYMIWTRTGHTNYWAYHFGLMCGWFGSLVLSLWMAEVFDREIIGRCIRVTKWLETVCFSKEA